MSKNTIIEDFRNKSDKEILALLATMEDINDIRFELLQTIAFFEARQTSFTDVDGKQYVEVIWILRPHLNDPQARRDSGWRDGYGYGWAPHIPEIEWDNDMGPISLVGSAWGRELVDNAEEVRRWLIKEGWKEQKGLFDLLMIEQQRSCDHVWVCSRCGEIKYDLDVRLFEKE